MWSAAAYVWNGRARRPGDRDFQDGTSGLLPTDLRIASRRPLSDKRAKILRHSLDAIMRRLTPNEADQFNAIYAEMEGVADANKQPRPAPTHGGVFACEGSDDDELSEEHPPLELPQHTMYENQSTQNRARERRREQGYSKNLLCVGDFIAYEPNYTAETRAEDRHDFWVGKVLGLDKETREVNIQLWHTPTKRNGAESRNGCVYSVWKGNRATRHTAELIHMNRVYESFDLTPARRIRKNTSNTS